MLNHKLVELFGKEQVVCSCGRRCVLVGGDVSLLEGVSPCWKTCALVGGVCVLVGGAISLLEGVYSWE